MSKKAKKYILVEFPYPSGEGLHMGHLRPYVAADVYSRYLRMRGEEVLFPMGWDAFGLPAENYAIKNKVHPREAVKKNIANAKRQLQSWEISFDWDREINTTDPDYYKWTQWIFLQFFKKGLAYEATGLINWCPVDKTGLANEEVLDGKCERCGTAVEKRELKQWYLKITAYAEKLLKGLKTLKEWPEDIKLQQENWIGKSEGAEIEFRIQNSEYRIKIFTTRPDTIFGATYMVLAPEHDLISKIKNQISNIKEIEKYIEKAGKKTEIQRTAEEKEKTGVELKGAKAINPATKEEIPVWIADYVLASYGTGAIMAVPAHDERDYAFAKKYKLSIKKVVKPKPLTSYRMTPYAAAHGQFNQAELESDCWTGDGELINSDRFNGMDSERAKWEITGFINGVKRAQYKLRDWVFSRQRYWGEPIPIIYCEKCGTVPVPEKDLPVELPDVKNYEPTGTGQSPLANVGEWVNVKCPECGGAAKRETNTMPQWAGSSWYYLRYIDPKNSKKFADKKKQKDWLPVDIYFGGREHTTLHLLYSRFWHLFLHDEKLAPSPEPYEKRVPHGMVLGPDGEKMSKSRGNIVSPDKVIETHGADALRMYEMFLGPHDATVEWIDEGIIGIKRFLDKIDKIFNFQFSIFKKDSNSNIQKLIHKTIKKVEEDIENYRFNTAISALMILVNEFAKSGTGKKDLEVFLKLLAPFAPKTAQKLWEKLGNKDSIHEQDWPEYDKKLAKDDVVEIAVQINGKTRATISSAPDASEIEVSNIAEKDVNVARYLEGKDIRGIIYVPGRIINFVI